jgi:hypothetical protein
VLRCAHAKKTLRHRKEAQRSFFKGRARKAGPAHFGEGHRQARAKAAVNVWWFLAELAACIRSVFALLKRAKPRD